MNTVVYGTRHARGACRHDRRASRDVRAVQDHHSAALTLPSPAADFLTVRGLP